MSPESADGSLEGIRITSETVSAAQLLKEIAHDGDVDVRYQFDGDFEYAPAEAQQLHSGTEFFSILRLNGYIVGIAQLLRRSEDLTKVALRNICIAKSLKGLRKGSLEEKNMRLSQKLLREVFDFVRSTHATLYVTRYTGEGKQRIKHQIEALAADEYKDVRVVQTREFGVFGPST